MSLGDVISETECLKEVGELKSQKEVLELRVEGLLKKNDDLERRLRE